jgi:hypothetical protein
MDDDVLPDGVSLRLDGLRRPGIDMDAHGPERSPQMILHRLANSRLERTSATSTDDVEDRRALLAASGVAHALNGPASAAQPFDESHDRRVPDAALQIEERYRRRRAAGRTRAADRLS